jgi:hypothetical protein
MERGQVMIDNLLRRLAIRRRTRSLNTMIQHAPGQTVRNDLMAIAARGQIASR